jgi:nucleoside-diphosphate-sugar epimerase
MAPAVLVTGGLGFIGAHVVRELLREGTPVIVIDREVAGNAADEVLSVDQRASLRTAAGTIPGVRALTRLLREHAVETVIHLASPLATVTEGNPKLVSNEMIAPHVAMLDACRLAQTRRLIWASSVGVFGRAQDYPGLPIANDAPHLPLTMYGAAKSFLERLSSLYSVRHGLETLGLRFPLVYGPGRRRGGGQFTTEMIEGAALARRCVVASADTKNDWMHVTDAAQSVLMAMHADRPTSRAFTVCGQAATTRDVAELLIACLPEAELELLPGAGDLVADFDCRPAFEQLGYRPSVTLRQGILATVNAARQRSGLPLVV